MLPLPEPRPPSRILIIFYIAALIMSRFLRKDITGLITQKNGFNKGKQEGFSA